MPKKLLVTILEELTDGERVSCQICKRKFAINRIEKHQQACENLSKKRPIFDIFKKRFPNYSESYNKKVNKKGSLNLIYPNSKWQKQHLELVRNLRYGEESSYEDYVPCPHCGRKFGQNTADKHIEICKNIIHKPRGVCMKKFPSVIKLKELTIRVPNNNCIIRPKSNNRPSNITTLNSFEYNENCMIGVNTSPLKTPLLKKSIKEMPTVECEKCGQMFLASLFDKHSLKCGKNLKPSATVSSLEKNDFAGSKSGSKSIRSNSTQRLGEVLPGCLYCGSLIPKKAKYCMMCGNIKLTS